MFGQGKIGKICLSFAVSYLYHSRNDRNMHLQMVHVSLLYVTSWCCQFSLAPTSGKGTFSTGGNYLNLTNRNMFEWVDTTTWKCMGVFDMTSIL